MSHAASVCASRAGGRGPNAWGYETTRIEYATARKDYLDAGGDPELVADTPGESDAHVFYWGTPSAGAYNACFKKELAEQTQVHNLEMQSLPVPDGGLLHMSYDDNTAIAKSVQLTGSNPNVKVGLATSAHTGFITSVALKSNGTWEAQEAQIDKLVEHHGEPRIFCTDNLPVNYSALKAKICRQPVRPWTTGTTMPAQRTPFEAILPNMGGLPQSLTMSSSRLSALTRPTPPERHRSARGSTLRTSASPATFPLAQRCVRASEHLSRIWHLSLMHRA